MAGPKTYAGVGSKARSVKSIYVGVSSKARKVIKAYAGVNGVARLVFSADWWLPAGVSAANCIAAYRFKGAASQTAALKDLTGHGYNLTKPSGVSWSAANGLYQTSSGTQRITNSSLGGQNILSYVLYYGNFDYETEASYLAINLCGGSYNARIASFMMNSGHVGTNNSWNSANAWATQPSFFYNRTTQDLILARYNLAASSVVGVSVSDKKMYKDGLLATVKDVAHDRVQEPQNPSNTQNLVWEFDKVSGTQLFALAFYSVNLTEAQHKSVYSALTS